MVTVASPSRSTELAIPSRHRALERSQRLARRLADDEAVRHVAHAGGGRGSQRLAPGGVAGEPHRGVDRRRALRHLVEVGDQVRAQVIDGTAGGRHIDEPKQRRPELRVLGGELHRLLVE